MSSIYKRGPAQLEANLTPMIDVTFLLIVFFVLVSQIVEVENVDLLLPQLEDPATDLPAKEQRSVINVVPGADGAAEEYRVGTLAFPVGADGIDALTRHVQGLLEVNPALRVNLRADQRTRYEWVHPVLKAVSAAAARVDGVVVTPRVNLVVVPEES
jgi:biopolymer transport protein ExbD